MSHNQNQPANQQITANNRQNQTTTFFRTILTPYNPHTSKTTHTPRLRHSPLPHQTNLFNSSHSTTNHLSTFPIQLKFSPPHFQFNAKFPLQFLWKTRHLQKPKPNYHPPFPIQTIYNFQTQKSVKIKSPLPHQILISSLKQSTPRQFPLRLPIIKITLAPSHFKHLQNTKYNKNHTQTTQNLYYSLNTLLSNIQSTKKHIQSGRTRKG